MRFPALLTLFVLPLMAHLPEYCDLSGKKSECHHSLRKKPKRVKFPLDEKTKEILRKLEDRFDSEENCAGLAAAQIGYPVRIIVLSAPNDPVLKRYRKDLTQSMPKTILINPTYEPVSEEKTVDYEACFSVTGKVSMVPRYKHIRYTAFLPDGTKIVGDAQGFLARIMQHEIDHTNGVLAIDRAYQVLTIEELKAMRKERVGATKTSSLQR